MRWDRQLTAGLPSDAASPESSEVVTAAPSAAPSPAPDIAPDSAPPPPTSGVALLEFARLGRSGPVVHDEALLVVNGVSVDDLQRGPGHDPGTSPPCRDVAVAVAVAGHRTTYGAPSLHLDSLRCRDRVLLTDRRGRLFTDEVARQRVVAPTDVWVIGEHPLGTGRPALTLTTCNPRFSAEQRLIVHAELVS